jgi:hypothetical protein
MEIVVFCDYLLQLAAASADDVVAALPSPKPETY